MRELEVLHDRLLALFEQDPTLTPKDVVVMMPDVNSYGPYIQAVFGKEGGKGGRGPRPDPLCDLRSGGEPGEPAAAKFPRPAQAAERPLRGGELLAILEVPAVLRRFELDDDEFNVLRRWVQETGIRWGLDDDHPERFCAAASVRQQLAVGLRRMLLGFAMGTGSRWRDPALCGHRRAAGADLGKLAWFVDSWRSFCPGCNRRSRWPSGTPARWRCWSASISPTRMKSASSSSFAASSSTGRPSSARPASSRPSVPTCCRTTSAACWGVLLQPALPSPVRSTFAP